MSKERERIMKHTKNIAAALLAVLAASSVMTACGGSGDTGAGVVTDAVTGGADSTVETSADTAELTDLQIRQSIPDNLPEVDYGGREFRIACSEEYNFHNEFWVEEQNGDQCNDAVYQRNEKIESRFNTKISIVSQGATDREATPKFLNKIAMAGDDAAELCAYVNYMAYIPIGQRSCLDWTEVPNVDLTQPWHNKHANDGATVNGKLFAICSDLSISSMTYTYAIFFNTRLTSNYDMEPDYLYDLVRSGDWTIDKFIGLTKDLYVDTNGNGSKDETDTFGFGYMICNTGDVWLTAFNQPLTVVKDDGSLEITFMSEKTESALTKMRDYQENSLGFCEYEQLYSEETYFAGGTVAFAPLRFSAAFTALRDMEDNYSILPYPKWDTAQEIYFTNADDKFQVFSIPTTAPDPEYIGTIFEAMSAESYRSVYPTYYDVALKGKYSSDPTPAEMFDLIMSGRKFEFSFQFGKDHFLRMPYLFRDLLLTPSLKIASKWATVEKHVNKTRDKFYALFEDQ